jgi:hypothetical protein
MHQTLSGDLAELKHCQLGIGMSGALILEDSFSKELMQETYLISNSENEGL